MARQIVGGLAAAVRGAKRPPQSITWEREDGEAEDLTGAVLTGWLRSYQTGAVRPIAGALTVTDGPGGRFLWSYADEDVAEAGEFDVQFNAAYSAGPSPARTFPARWVVKLALG